MDNWTVVAWSVAAILLVLVALAVVDARMLPAASWLRSLLVSLACAAAGSLTWLVEAPIIAPQVVGELFAPIAALAAVAAYLATIAVRAGGGRVFAALVFSVLWSGIVFVPTAILTFTPFATSWPISLQPVDHGGSLALNVASGAAALGVLLGGGSRQRTAPLGLRRGVVAMVVLCAGWLMWLVGAELAIDDVTPGILINGIVGAGGGVIGWVVAQRISHTSTTLNAVAAGVVSGLVAVTAGAPLFTPLSAALAGIVAGGAACIFTLQRVGHTRRQQWFVVGSHLVAGAVGIIALGLFATGMGFVFTGSIALIQNQILSTVVVTAYSTTVAFVLWMPLRAISSRYTRATPPPA